MASTGQMTGMRGVYLVAAELSRRGFIVSPTSRSAAGADLLVTDQQCKTAWSVQVKTNVTPRPTFLVGKSADKHSSPSHVFVLVNLKADRENWPDYYVVRSEDISKNTIVKPRGKKGDLWYWVTLAAMSKFKENWEIFGDPHAQESGPDNEEPESEADEQPDL